jgi:hypothetical protein
MEKQEDIARGMCGSNIKLMAFTPCCTHPIYGKLKANVPCLVHTSSIAYNNFIQPPLTDQGLQQFRQPVCLIECGNDNGYGRILNQRTTYVFFGGSL